MNTIKQYMAAGGSMNTIKQYTVVADPETGEWLSKPQFVGYVIEKEWLEKKDTDLAHFDFFERSDLTGESLDFDPWPNSETCAIEERWTDYWWPSDGEVT